MLQSRTFNVVIASPENMVSLEELPATGVEISYDGSQVVQQF
jgi:hypothetical protein